MKTWLKLSLILCFFGFLKEIRPSEPFIYEYLTGPWRNITGNEVITKVYPVATYGYLVLLVIVFLITDLLRYRPLIIALGISGIIFSGMLIWTTSLLALQVLEIFYSIFMAAEVAYYTYIYAKVEKEHYTIVTSQTRASILVGRFCSGVMAQILISYEWMSYKELNYITFSAMLMATCWSFFLPSVEKSIYFYRESEEQEQTTNGRQRFIKGIYLMKTEIIQSFKSVYVMKWSLWYALGTCCFLQVQSYMQPLWKEIMENPNEKIYNGAVEAVLTLFGFSGALIAGILKIDWAERGIILRVTCCSIQGIIIVIGATTSNIYICYICYIVYGSIYHFVITIASSEIAKQIQDDTFGLVFGFNTFIAMIFQSLITLIAVNDVFNFMLNVRQQYLVYGCFCLAIAFIDIFISILIHVVKARVIFVPSQ